MRILLRSGVYCDRPPPERNSSQRLITFSLVFPVGRSQFGGASSPGLPTIGVSSVFHFHIVTPFGSKDWSGTQFKAFGYFPLFTASGHNAVCKIAWHGIFIYIYPTPKTANRGRHYGHFYLRILGVFAGNRKHGPQIQFSNFFPEIFKFYLV